MNGHELDTLDGRVPLCPEGTVIKGRWRVAYQIGMGAFGEIYVARNVNTQERVAIKVEVADEKKQALRAEVAIMRRLQGCPYVCQFISCGRQDNINFLVMELLGENLSNLRKRQPRGAFSMATVCRLGCEMVEALQAVHGMGVMHRDVKPSNFVLGGRHKAAADPALANKLYIIDFGLSRKYVGPDNEIKPPRANAGFRGTARYASVNSHQCKELAPRDDLWSVFYVMVEFATGTLPWRNQRDRDKVGEMKQQYMAGKKLTDGLPPEFEDFMAYLLTLDYYSKPDYGYIIKLFRGLLLRIIGLPPSMTVLPSQIQLPPYEWERPALASAGSAAAPTSSTNASSANGGGAGAGGAGGGGAGGKKEFHLPLFKRRAVKPHNVPVGSMAAGTTGQTTLFEDDDLNRMDAIDGDGGGDTGVALNALAPSVGADRARPRIEDEDGLGEDIVLGRGGGATTQQVPVRNDAAAGPAAAPRMGCCCIVM